MYLSTSKLAVAAVGNLSFAVALCMYNLVIKVCCISSSCSWQDSVIGATQGSHVSNNIKQRWCSCGTRGLVVIRPTAGVVALASCASIC